MITSPKPVIDTFTEDDRHRVVTLWGECGLTRPWNDPDKDIDRKVADSPWGFIVLRLGNAIIGSAMFGYDGHRGSVNYLSVHPAHRGKGYARLLMEHGEALLLARGCPKINLLVRSGNEEVTGLYRQLGYVPDDVVELGKRLIKDD
ncbi:GNAT family acetyltransferase [Pannonibacter indicus]|jgi:ribosomal protein S18 acetylase RimI-like enzyme|uniref:Acetyltransferase (GNAT) family n=1 Tax=Pannonibacter indicus TaxID=466044 RepID=A0A0K6I7W4_9HYPH|nr:GNAT family acetyltransferase [Pannonibacter indicus]CUA99417.1 Acetyltransferase (GNAT) family [Pannonibacter indicus]